MVILGDIIGLSGLFHFPGGRDGSYLEEGVLVILVLL